MDNQQKLAILRRRLAGNRRADEMWPVPFPNYFVCTTVVIEAVGSSSCSLAVAVLLFASHHPTPLMLNIRQQPLKTLEKPRYCHL